jgi:hypothetical protein
VRICHSNVTSTNSAFCPHTLFICFVWIWEQVAILSLYSINWLVQNRDLTHYSPVVTIWTTSLTFSNYTFCLHSVFMCFVWIWEQTAIFNLHIANWLVSITKTEYVSCAVRTRCWLVLVFKGGSIAQAVTRGLWPRMPGFDLTPVRVACVEDKWALGKVFPEHFDSDPILPSISS